MKTLDSFEHAAALCLFSVNHVISERRRRRLFTAHSLKLFPLLLFPVTLYQNPVSTTSKHEDFFAIIRVVVFLNFAAFSLSFYVQIENLHRNRWMETQLMFLSRFFSNEPWLANIYFNLLKVESCFVSVQPVWFDFTNLLPTNTTNRVKLVIATYQVCYIILCCRTQTLLKYQAQCPGFSHS